MMEQAWKKIFKESAPMLTITAFVGIMMGQMLNSIESILIDLPVLLFLFPVLNGVGGNLGIVLGARLSSGFHSGYIDVSLQDPELIDNMKVVFLLGGVTYLLFALFVGASSLVTDIGLHLLELFAVILITGLTITIVIILVSVGAAYYSYKKGLDPDNIVTPVVTTTGDFLGITALLTVIWLVIL